MISHDLPLYHIGCRSDDYYIGGTKWGMNEEIIDVVMRQHVADHPMPMLLKILAGDNSMSRFAIMTWLKNRFLTFEEYLTLFDKPTDNYIYLFTGDNETQRKLFLSSYRPTKEGYFSLMKKVNPQMWEFFFQWADINIPAKERRLHTYCIGASGCGKTELIKNQIIQDVKHGNSTVIFIDPKGDAALQLAKHNINLIDPDRLIYIDPFLDRNMTPVINPFDIPNKSEYFDGRKYKLIIEKRASQIMRALMQIFADADAKFMEKMQTYLYPALCKTWMMRGGRLIENRFNLLSL